MTDIQRTGRPDKDTAVVHESYSFACMRCGHGWEQSYVIEHHLDAKGRQYVVYLTDGHRVPSPLSRPTCGNCGGHVVRIMRPGRVSAVRRFTYQEGVPGRAGGGPLGAASLAMPAGDADTTGRAGAPPAADTVPHGGATLAGARRRHHWRLSDLLHPFRHTS